MLRMVALISLFNILALGLTTLTGPVVARMLGPSGRGELALVMLWPTALASISLFGADVTIGRMAARWPQATLALRALALRLSLALGIGIMAVGALTIPGLLLVDKPALWAPTFVLLAVIPCQLFVVMATAIAVNSGHMWGFNVPRFGFSGAYLLLVVSLWGFGLSQVRYVAMAFAAAAFATAVLAYVMARKPSVPSASRAAPDAIAATEGAASAEPGEPLDAMPPLTVGVTMRASLGFGSAALLEAGSQHVPMALLSFMVAPAEIGLYAVSLTAAASLQDAFGTAVARALFAQVAAGEDGGLAVAARLRYTLVLYAMLAGGMMVVIPPLMPIVFGAEFAAAESVAFYMIPAASLISMARVYNETLKGAGRAKPAMIARVVGPLVLSAVALALVPRVGVVGMVGALGVEALVMIALFIRATAQHFRVPISSTWLVRPDDIVFIFQRMLGLLRQLQARLRRST